METKRKFSREFKLEAVKMVQNREVALKQVARDLDLNENMLRRWVREFGVDPKDAFPGLGQMKPEQAEIARLQREVAKINMERDILKKPKRTLRRNRCEVRFLCKTTRCVAN